MDVLGIKIRRMPTSSACEEQFLLKAISVTGSSLSMNSKERLYISSALKREIINAYGVGAKLLGQPYEYDKAVRECRKTAGNWIYLWYFNVALAHSHWIFITLRTVQTFRSKGQNLETRMFMLVWTSIMSLTNTCQHIIFWHGEEIITLFNKSIKFFDRFSSRCEYDPNYVLLQKLTPVIVITMKSFVYGCVVAVPMAAMYCFWDPNLPLYPTSMLDNPNDQLLFMFQTAYVVYAVYTMYILMTGIFMVAFNCLTFGFLIAMALASIRKSKSSITVINVRRDEDLKWYKELELLQVIFNSAFGQSFLPAVDVLWAGMAIGAILASVKTSGVIAFITIFTGFYALVLLLSTFRSLANIFCNSTCILRYWERNCIGSGERRYVRSLRPIRATVGAYFFVDPMLVLTVINIIVTQSISILLLEK